MARVRVTKRTTQWTHLREIDAVDECARGSGRCIHRESEVAIHVDVIGEQLVCAGAQRVARRRLPREHGAGGELPLENQTSRRRHAGVRAAHLTTYRTTCGQLDMH